MFDLWGEIAKLPGPTGQGVDTAAVRATGTDGAVARPVALRVGRKGVKLAAHGRSGEPVSSRCHGENTLQNKGKTAFLTPSANLGRQDSNLEPSDPESDVLPIAPRPNKRSISRPCQHSLSR